MKSINSFQEKTDAMLERVQDYLASLSLRERVMVIAGAIIVTVALVGYGLWKTNAAANQQQKRLTELKDTLVWMQSNVASMKPNNDSSLTTADKVQRVAQQQGLAIAAQEVGKQIQIVAEHANYAVLANFIMQLAQAGLSIEKLELNKSAGQIKLTATVQ
ncbi:type II secretion system protein GspM [Acinetobacter shaoyimingii]|uniref:Type II secretion system protein M n=1 Tax=Acinetobacter shaoyimingii TaxID=2715164 RepID=A0A6G8RWQ9_9GAMM|nr:type II secretion system protein GspM [Acinetobacter shaoyimingii]NHB57089.1 type II secretion system protein M [Acinetobacter shaoyimingii]QIO06291.1 type II secretion system protein M [Acinetobacter shaoyimingii]